MKVKALAAAVLAALTIAASGCQSKVAVSVASSAASQTETDAAEDTTTVTELPTTEEPSTAAPVTEAPTTEAPTTEPVTEEPAPREYTGVELAAMNFKDIVAIMGDYDTTRGILSPAFSSEPIPYYYNTEKLPGFYFTNLPQGGNFDTRSFSIAIKDGAKLNDSISSDMTYKELAEVIGDFDVQGVGAETTLVHHEEIDGHLVSFVVSPDNGLYKKTTGGKITSDILREENPRLHSIGIRSDR